MFSSLLGFAKNRLCIEYFTWFWFGSIACVMKMVTINGKSDTLRKWDVYVGFLWSDICLDIKENEKEG